MANYDFPRGFQPVRKTDGSKINLQYNKVAAANGAIDKFDLLEARDDGFFHRAQASSVTIVGVAAEFKAASAGGSIAYYPADATTIFRAQADDATIAAQTNLNLNYNITAGTASGTGMSVMEIDASTGATTASLPIKVLKVEEVVTPNGNALGANVVVECLINQGAYKGAGADGV